MSEVVVNQEIAQDVARIFLEIKAVSFRFDPPYTYASGLKSPIYLDNRLIMSYPKIRREIISYDVDVIKKNIGLENIDWISATATAAIPLGAWIAEKLNLPMVYVRPTTKTYGKGGKIMGYLKKGSNVLIIEDHISTAESVVDNAKKIRELGGKVEYCITTTTYETKESIERLKKNNIQLFALTTGRIIVEVAAKEKYLAKEKKELVDLWFEDPHIWATKYGAGKYDNKA